MTINASLLREQYTVADMAYLDGPDAALMYEVQAAMIYAGGHRSIVDVGCRTGSIRRYLTGSYRYLGFDTSREPIEFAKTQSPHPDHSFVIASWDDPPVADFIPDVLMFGAVLIYATDPWEMFRRLMNHYGCTTAVIQEPTRSNSEAFDYIDLTAFCEQLRTATTVNLHMNIPCGNRTIIYATI